MIKLKYINIIKKCPYCNSDLIVVNNNGIKILKCDNENCSQRLTNRIEHFCSKNHGLDIKGLGKQTISLLVDWGWLNGLADIFRLEQHKTEWISKTGFGQASVDKILNAIDESKKNVNLTSFISALGIPLVGRTVAKDITFIYSTWEDFRDAVGGDWTEFEGFGPEICKSINTFDYTEADEIATHFLTFQTLEDMIDEIEISTEIKDKVFCITGKLKSGEFKNRDELKADIESRGGRVASSVTSRTDYLISNEASTSAKSVKAKELGVKVITEEEYLSMR